MNTKALQRAIDLGKKGATIKSKTLLFMLGIMNQAATWKKTNTVLKRVASLFSENGLFHISVKQNNRRVNFSLRENNNSDYQSLFECFAGMYKIPDRSIKYVLDGGANIGLFSIDLFVENRSIQEIICVEPNPSNLKLLIPNVGELPAKILSAAISDFKGTATFNFKEHNTGHIDGSPGHEYFHEQDSVNCLTITDVISPSWDMEYTLVKLDIEGQEYKVFNNMFNVNIFPKYIAAELHDYFHAGGSELVEKFVEHGYDVIIDGKGEEGNVCRQIFAERKTSK